MSSERLSKYFPLLHTVVNKTGKLSLKKQLEVTKAFTEFSLSAFQSREKGQIPHLKAYLIGQQTRKSHRNYFALFFAINCCKKGQKFKVFFEGFFAENM